MINLSGEDAPRSLYRTKDGHWVDISASGISAAQRTLRLVGNPEVVDKPGFRTGSERARHADMCDKQVANWIADHTRVKVASAFQQTDAALAAVYDIKALIDDPHVHAADSIATAADDDSARCGCKTS